MAEIFNNKEISWLSFNERVLQEAENPATPLGERIYFLGIYSNNLDEFFRVRVATLKRLSTLGKKAISIIGENPKRILKEINNIVIEQALRFDTIFKQILLDLEQAGIYLLNEHQLNNTQAEFVTQYFKTEVRPKLIPIIIGQSVDFPTLKDDAIYMAISLIKHEPHKVNYALIRVPSDVLPRFINLPSDNDKKYLILLDDVLRFGLKDVFYIFDFDDITAHVIKLTKDAELDISNDMSESYIKKVSMSVKKRTHGNLVRFVFDESIPPDLLSFLIKKMKFKKDDAKIPGGRYHNFKDFMQFPTLDTTGIKYPKRPALPHKDFTYHKGILSSIKKKDILLHFPYHSFDNFIDLLREAAIDPKVQDIKITLYRLAKNSSVINALINAARNGKNVEAVVEIQARFDEEANIYWSNKLVEEGVKVIFGVKDLKVHCKLCYISRKERNEIVSYACVGTGNFNEETTRVFSDVLLLTFDKRITAEVAKVFEFFDKNYFVSTFTHLMIAPFFFRKKIERLINIEIKNAKAGKPAYMYLKMNNLVDDEVVNKLYEAAMAGVKIKLNIRGMFSLMPNLPELKNNIEAIGIIDRYLEHSRVFVFANGGNEKYFISSGDIMKRNLDIRVETVCPIYDAELKKELKTILNIQWSDNVKARILNNELSNEFNPANSELPIRSQEAIYNYFKEFVEDRLAE